MKKPSSLQIVQFNKTGEICQHCKKSLTNIKNMTYLKKRWGYSKHWDELHKCDNCTQTFLLRHNIFDGKGHIHSFVFTEDINNTNYNWMDNLNEVQKLSIAKHIKKCSLCQKNLSNQLLMDAHLKELFQNLKRK